MMLVVLEKSLKLSVSIFRNNESGFKTIKNPLAVNKNYEKEVFAEKKKKRITICDTAGTA